MLLSSEVAGNDVWVGGWGRAGDGGGGAVREVEDGRRSLCSEKGVVLHRYRCWWEVLNSSAIRCWFG